MKPLKQVPMTNLMMASRALDEGLREDLAARDKDGDNDASKSAKKG